MSQVSLLSEDRFEKNAMKILIVDDDETILHVLKGFFVRNGFRVLAVRDGLEAMEILKMENPSALVSYPILETAGCIFMVGKMAGNLCLPTERHVHSMTRV